MSEALGRCQVDESANNPALYTSFLFPMCFLSVLLRPPPIIWQFSVIRLHNESEELGNFKRLIMTCIFVLKNINLKIVINLYSYNLHLVNFIFVRLASRVRVRLKICPVPEWKVNSYFIIFLECFFTLFSFSAYNRGRLVKTSLDLPTQMSHIYI